jgi:predicted GH43/DUF377 family glycosyl hydrolase
MEWEKLGQIFDPTKVQGKDWMKSHAQCPSTLVFDDIVRVYFSCRPQRDSNGQELTRTTFLDFDRKDLTKVLRIADKPILELGELGCFDEHGIYPSSVIKFGDEVRFYYAGWSRCSSVPFNCSVGMAISHDNGVTFERYGRGAILSQCPDEPYLISGAKVRIFDGKWYLYYLAGTKWMVHNGRPECVYKIRIATSDDGIKWERYGRGIIENILEENECQAGGDVFYYNGLYHMYFTYRYALDFRNKDRGYRIGYAYSNDLFNWIRDDKNAGIGLSESGWDSEMQHYPHVFELDGNHYMIYNGNDFGRYGLGLAILKK